MSNAWQPPPPPTTPMDPQLKSIITSVLMLAASGLSSWAVGHGFIPATDQGNLTNELVGAVFAGGAMLLVWWKARAQSPKALITAVNAADNGVKVVRAEAAAPMVSEPVKGSK